jgi:integrase
LGRGRTSFWLCTRGKVSFERAITQLALPASDLTGMSGGDGSSAPNRPLRDAVERALAARHLSVRTRRAYTAWIHRYVTFHDPRLPLVLTRDEVRRVLEHLHGTVRLMAQLLYGSGLRLLECARLRVKDIDFSAGHLLIRDAKGQKDRITLLPVQIRAPLRDHLATVQSQHSADLAAGAGYVELPGALLAKYPRAARDWPWQWVFPASFWATTMSRPPWCTPTSSTAARWACGAHGARRIDRDPEAPPPGYSLQPNCAGAPRTPRASVRAERSGQSR